jgi:hypothetical protein
MIQSGATGANNRTCGLAGRNGMNWKVELQLIIAFITGAVSFAWLVLQTMINKARERGLVDRVKQGAISLSFWKNVFAVIGMIAVLLFVGSLFVPAQKTPPPVVTIDDD